MAEIALVVASDPVRLLSHAGSGFLQPLEGTPHSPFPTPDYLLVLRQASVQEDLIRQARARGVRGWFDPPIATFQDLPRWLGLPVRAPCRDFERVALLSRVVRQTAGEVLGKIRRLDRYLGALDAFVGELVSEDVAPDDYLAAVRRIEDRDAFQRHRDDELVEIYRQYRVELDRADLRDPRGTLVDCAAVLAQDPEGLTKRLGGRRELRLFGLCDLRGGWKQLLEALRQCPALDRVQVYALEPCMLELDEPVTRVALDADDTLAPRLFETAHRGTHEFTCIEAPSVEREVGEVARRIRILAERGVPLTDIAVVSRQSQPYVDLVLRALARFGVPATARLRRSYAEVPVVKGVLALFAAAADQWSRATVAELADQPYMQHRLDGGVLNAVGYRRAVQGLDDWRNELREMEKDALEVEQEPEPRWQTPTLPRAERVRSARDAFERFMAQVRVLDDRHPLGWWITWLADLIADDPWELAGRIYDVPEERYDVARMDLIGWRGLARILAEWREALDRWGGADIVMSAAEYHQRLREMLAAEAAPWTEMRRGVRVLEGWAGAYRSFAHVFIVGMDAGGFPLGVPRSPILSDSERSALGAAGVGLMEADRWERDERDLFRALVAAAREYLTVSYSRVDPAGRETIRSAYVEALGRAAEQRSVHVDSADVLAPDMPLCGADVSEHAYRVARIEWERRSGVLSPYNGAVSDVVAAQVRERFDEDYVWSPTQLEEYAKCPWAFFSSRLLRLEKRIDPSEEMEATTRGSIFHDALARFFNRIGQHFPGPVFLRAEHLELAIELMDYTLDEIFTDYERTAWLGHPVLRDASRRELKRVLADYLRWEAQQHEDMFDRRKQRAPSMLRTGVQKHEAAFDGVVLESQGVRVKFRGVIDRVEVGIDERVDAASSFVAAVDYKTSAAATPGGGDPKAWEDGVVLQVPLYAHALTQLDSEVQVSRVEYRALLHPSAVHTLELHRVDRKSGVRFTNHDDTARMERALEAAARSVSRVRAGEFPAAPPTSCMCPPFCHAWDICRVAGGPQVKRERR